MDGDKQHDSSNPMPDNSGTPGEVSGQAVAADQQAPEEGAAQPGGQQAVQDPPPPVGDVPKNWAEAPDETVSWTASEFIAHQKTPGWYAALTLVTAVAAGVIWLITRDMVATVVIVLAGVMFGAYASRKPKQITYALNGHQLTVGQVSRPLNQYRSFSVTQDGAFSSIVLTPLQRFGVLTTIYLDPKDEDKVVEILSRRLPHEEHRPDSIDRALRRIRF